jgi:NAD(P)H dehydrogenase (quinone)
MAIARQKTEQERNMFAITGITGRVGAATARALLARGRRIRAVVRDRAKAAPWTARGAEVALADLEDPTALQAAFTGVDGVFVTLPPNFDPAPAFPEARAMAVALRQALAAAATPKVVALSSVGAQHAAGVGLITQAFILERELRRLPIPRAFLRAAWFMDNAIWDIASARSDGMIASYLSPLDRAIPMVATADIGAVAADVLTPDWNGLRTIEIEGPRPYAPADVAGVLADLLGQPVRAEVVPHHSWADRFRRQGQTNPTPRIRMLDGFNSGWVAFQDQPSERVAGTTRLEAVLRPMIARTADAA